MTNEEAIKKLKSFCHNCSKYPQCVNTDRECFEALDMAIEALKQTDGDLISRDFMKELGATCIAKRSETGELVAISSIDNLPRAEKTAELRIVGNTTMHYECSLCGGAVDKWDNYCKHCGAKMKGEAEREKAEQTAEKPIKHFGSIECPNCGRLLMLEEQPAEELDGDLISRKEVLKEGAYFSNRPTHTFLKVVKELPAIPQTKYENYEVFGWCKGCKEYDTEKHCCHRYSSFIRESLQENINAVLEDIKADLRKAISDFAMDNGDTAYGLRIALYIIDNHISGKEEE